MIRQHLYLLCASAFWGATGAHACDLGEVKGVRLRIATVECNSGNDTKTQELQTGDALAVKITVPAGTDLAALSLKRMDGLPAAAEPTPRRLADGSFFANLAFAAPGRWLVGIELKQDKGNEKLQLEVPVRLNSEQAAAALANASPVPAFRLTDLSGQKVTLASLKGKVWVANLFFASCPEVCPLMASQLAELQRTFKDQKDFRIVSVTTDPTSDTPEILQAFAKRHSADPARWLFLRGTKEQVVALSEGGLKLDARADSPMHSMRFALVGRDGVVKARYDSTKLEEREQLKLSIKEQL